MIDRQQFETLIACYGKSLIIEVIDIFIAQREELMKVIEHDLINHDLVGVRQHVHKLKGSLRQLYDTESSEHAEIMEQAAQASILAIVDSLMDDYPDTLRQMRVKFDDSDLVQDKIKPCGNLRSFLSGFTEALSTEQSRKLEELEQHEIFSRFRKMFSDLEASTALLLKELAGIKKELTSK